MKKLIIATTVGLAITMVAGCAQKSVVRYGDATAVETTDINFGSTDLQKVAGDMTDSLLLSPVVGTLTQNKRPIMFVERIKNKTSEHIDTESITDSISTKLLRSGKFRFVDMGRVEAAREQIKFQQGGGMVDTSKAVQFGKQIGAEYMLYGNLSSIVKSNKDKSDVYYKFTLRLMDLESGLVEWADETEIRKTKAKESVGW
ncbi:MULTISPECIES: penicillin-binding protein activator LpoB [unclassified Colwellia]|uniref:penicillin-binding protein activator LpoB n=1 Tax=unclassified Colwellia TaxID=196834 RepID=UPI0015F4D119|nr:MULTISPECIES: penicillin-binding protein activator LpoB [unclassified Colwellia]MBA6233944.1 penicillin-binding protein activator LpoB [Colwellia sp. MB02u-7]MBA6237581.1 penicillin-binding protein activator LpoB [Colwellia sp. MB02u-11]MBA6256083.1 penicillin-binding protein activator LpoB [Colwellia sp. MB3u-28]MBA6260816.1 penicillin-binding protein activator LpoB [Colwellia sp. MB3u-41]MBA6300618.1 penicillin-binding protein activator LpoB [Colwellia sp. MB3u-22]